MSAVAAANKLARDLPEINGPWAEAHITLQLWDVSSTPLALSIARPFVGCRWKRIRPSLFATAAVIPLSTACRNFSGRCLRQAFDECQQVGVNRGRFRRRHAVWEAFVDF